MMPRYMDFGLWPWAWGLVGLLFWVLIIVAIVLGVRWMVGAGHHDHGPVVPPPPPPPTAPRPDDPLEILRARYARGEIDDEEYQRRRKTLTGG